MSGGRATNLSPTLLQVDDLPNGNPNISTASWIWSNYTMAASGDAPVAVLVRVDVRIRFANQNTAGYKRISLLTHSQPSTINPQHHQLLIMKDQTASTEGVLIIVPNSAQNGDINNINNDNNNNDSNQSSTYQFDQIQILGVTGGCIGVLAGIAAAVLVVRMKKRIMSSVTMKMRDFRKLNRFKYRKNG